MTASNPKQCQKQEPSTYTIAHMQARVDAHVADEKGRDTGAHRDSLTEAREAVEAPRPLDETICGLIPNFPLYRHSSTGARRLVTTATILRPSYMPTEQPTDSRR